MQVIGLRRTALRTVLGIRGPVRARNWLNYTSLINQQDPQSKWFLIPTSR